jgi:hypothetical protein
MKKGREDQLVVYKLNQMDYLMRIQGRSVTHSGDT